MKKVGIYIIILAFLAIVIVAGYYYSINISGSTGLDGSQVSSAVLYDGSSEVTNRSNTVVNDDQTLLDVLIDQDHIHNWLGGRPGKIDIIYDIEDKSYSAAAVVDQYVIDSNVPLLVSASIYSSDSGSYAGSVTVSVEGKKVDEKKISFEYQDSAEPLLYEEL